ncbi:C4-dicarboxylate ABC transporter [Bacillus pseudomycoides]|uniref:C4-dicarboxylate ABC transporter n=1 Tax=Bacillus pseudomycoides TaxID=64104 RepID=A0A2A8C7S0_9BACI|nr:C4-dicarboxylate ABC transporter [Bacillus pseudomycoides]PEA84555.1 C4-dicarboxylate ABC transporter [Bacillus pseudomycoides]PED06866.1 C4-dicarboxylate ABC transporter [Bacillus pseudomycoides]PED69837.1 C4-dicarboxylate ABC transporter [Bacillus pseudomycoides]PEI39027.1 C4-dicarboxylate ABC transporter [Bacillus pseudomycoides]
MASTLSAMHVIPLEGLALLLGGNRFLSETRAIVNLIANGIATVVVAKRENEFNEGKGKQMLIRMQKEKIAG